ncbi:hypothetical protein E4U41_004726, partial [Claviceps citrina]
MAAEAHSGPDTTAPIARRRRPQTDPIEEAVAKSDAAFAADYLPSLPPDWKHPAASPTPRTYTLQLVGAAALRDAHAAACLDLIAETSGDDYRRSSLGWHPGAKKREMRSPALRYILVLGRGDDDDDAKVCGFTSMMPTYENGEPVLYCYEIHLKPELRG